MTMRIFEGGRRRSLPAIGTGTASIALVCGGMLWGLYWIPIRLFQSFGLDGPWPGIVMYVATLLVLTPALILQWRAIAAYWRVLAFSGAFTGLAFSLFSISLVYTDVIRAILLFYLTPIWGTLLGLAFLGERLSAARAIGLTAGIAGLVVVLGNGSELLWPRNIGDWLALVSGVTWAFGTLGLYRTKDTPVLGQIGAFLMGALVVSLIAATLFGNGAGATFDQLASWPVLPLAMLSTLYILPMVALTIWPATLLTPARVGLLLMSEVAVGLISAALFAGEPFGLREACGALLIVSAAFIEVSRG